MSCTDLYTMQLNGTKVRRLTSTNACELEPVYSPDGAWIAYRAQTEYATHIVVTRSDGSREGRRVFGSGTSPDWSPDGTSIAYADGERIEIVTPEGRSMRTLELDGPSLGSIASLTWSPAGDALIFSQLYGGTRGSVRAALRLYRVRADGTGRKELTAFSIIDDDDDPAWQPVR